MEGVTRRALSRAARLGLLALTLAACQDEGDPEALAQNQSAQRAASNQCADDAQCAPTGCHGTICRARRDARFCEHQLVLSRDPRAAVRDAELVDRVTTLLRQTLRADEAHSIQVVPERERVQLFFHTDPERRVQVEALFARVEPGGLFVWHPESSAVARRLLADDDDAHRRLSARRARGGPLLVEAVIEGGDIMAARQRLTSALTPLLPPDARLAFEVLATTAPPVVRAWLLSPPAHIDLRRLSALQPTPGRDDDAVLTLRGRLDALGARALASLSAAFSERLVVLSVGDEVIAAPRLEAPIRDGVFDLRFAALPGVDRAAAAHTLLTRIERLRATPALADALTLDVDATRRAEAYLPCYQADPPLARCGCVEGRCQWADTAPLEACIDDPPLPP